MRPRMRALGLAAVAAAGLIGWGIGALAGGGAASAASLTSSSTSSPTAAPPASSGAAAHAAQGPCRTGAPATS